MLSEQENYNSVETLERNTEIQLTYSWLLFQLINKLKAKKPSYIYHTGGCGQPTVRLPGNFPFVAPSLLRKAYLFS